MQPTYRTSVISRSSIQTVPVTFGLLF